MNIAVIGAGNGGQTMAGHLAIMGYEVSLYDIDVPKIIIGLELSFFVRIGM